MFSSLLKKEMPFKEIFEQDIWYPVFFAIGILIYFTFPTEPNFLLLVLCSICAFYVRKCFFFLCLGMLWPLMYALTCQPMIFPTEEVSLIGKVKSADFAPEFQMNLILTDVTFLSDGTLRTADKIALKAPLLTSLHTGDIIETKAQFLPVKNSLFSDKARTLFFRGIKGNARSTGNFHILKKSKKFSFFPLRLKIFQKLYKHLPRSEAALSVALILGEQSFIPPDIYEAYKASGIVHILSVSGFHLTLVAGMIFLLLRYITAPFERMNGKTVALWGAFLFSGFYLFLSGCYVPTVRSFIMLAFMLMAGLLGRQAFSVRNVVMAGFLILIISPDSLFNPSFQFSVTAVLLLITGLSLSKRFFSSSKTITGYLWNFFLSFWVVQTFAGMLTLPFIWFYFPEFHPYAFVGNLTLAFGFSFLVLPLLFIGILGIPFGIESAFWLPAGGILSYLNDFAFEIQSWPFAMIPVSLFSSGAVLVYAGGILCLCLGKKSLKTVGIFLMVIAFILPKTERLAYVKEDNWVVKMKDGKAYSPFPEKLSFLKSYLNIRQLEKAEKECYQSDGLTISFSEKYPADLVFADADKCFSPSLLGEMMLIKTGKMYRLMISSQKDKYRLWFPLTERQVDF